MKLLRIYCDTSVIGGCYDAEFAADSMRLMEAVQRGRLVLLLSDVVLAELADAPAQVQQVLERLPVTAVEKVGLTDEVLALRDAYLAAKILGSRWADDAAHVAAATVARADAIVSWNFQHIVRLDKMKAYNQVNLLEGYGILTIVTPKEVLSDDKNEK
jgi:predicted nucleic acid-binding protein